MFCTNCRKEYEKSDKFCAQCGNSFTDQVDLKSNTLEADKENRATDSKGTITKSIIDGRMNRKEFAIITLLPYLGLILLAVTSEIIDETWYYYATAIPLALFWIIFGYFASIRRLHDLDKSAWWLLTIAFAALLILTRESLELVGVDTYSFDGTVLGVIVNIIALAGILVFLSLLLWPGTKGSNRFGDLPGRKLSVRSIFYNLQSTNEKLDLTYLLWAAGIILSIAGVIFFYFASDIDNSIQTISQQQEINEFLGVKLGADRVDVTLLKGSPDDEIQRENATRLIYKDSGGLIESVIDLDPSNKVKRICSEEFMYKVYDLGENSTLEEVESTLGSAPEVSISSDGTMMITTYPLRNVAFVFSRNQVTSTCVTSEDKISFTEEYQNN